MSLDELKDFIRWLKSPWCNSNKNLPRLVEQLLKLHPDYDSRKLTKEKLFLQILPNGKYSDRRMNNLMSEGYLAGERFIVFQNLEKDIQLQSNLLSQEFEKRRLDLWFYKTADEFIHELEEKTIKEWEDHLELAKMYRRIYHYPNQDPRTQTRKQTITRISDELDWVYVLEKAAIINEKIFRNRILQNENHDIELELKKWETAYQTLQHPALEMYKKRFEYVESEMQSQFFDLCAYFFEHFEKISFREQQSQLFSLLNDAFYLRRKRELQLSDIFPIYKFGFKNDLFLLDGIITRVTYTTAIVISNSLEDFDYSMHIIKHYSQHLSGEIRNDAINWAHAHTYSKKEQFEECLETLLSHDFRIIYFQRIIRVLTLQTYFELYLNTPDSYLEYLLSYCSAFEKWIQREKRLSKLLKASYFKFIQKCRAMVKIHSAVEFSEKDLKELLQHTNNIEAIDWLLSKQQQILQIKTG